jgi:hypothetical protein
MAITAYRAVYGAKEDGSHDLLRAPSQHTDLLTKLLRYTDKPGILKLGAFPGPALSGFPLEEFYVLLKIFRDPDASRSGMVRTYALILPLKEVSRVNGISPFLERLPDELTSNPDSNLELEVEINDAELNVSRSETDTKYVPLAQGVMATAGKSEPVIWSEAQNLGEAASMLWSGLWPSVREHFYFHHAAGPQDLGSQDHSGEWVTLVGTPEGRKGKWGNRHTVDPNGNDDELTLAESYLLRLPEGEVLRRFGEQLGASLGSLDDLTKLENCYQYFTQREKLDLGKTIALATLAGHLSLDPERGEEIKSQIVARISESFPSADPEDINRLRNFDPQSFRKGESVIKNSLISWSNSNILEESHGDLISQCFSSSPSHLWKEAILKGFSEALKEWPSHAPNVLWKWWKTYPGLVQELEKYIPSEDAIETDLSGATPKEISETLGGYVGELAQQRGWPKLGAMALVSSLPPDEAFDQFLESFQFSGYLSGLRAASTRVDSAEVIEIALDIQNESLHSLAGELCVEEPSLLSNLDVENPGWRSIWLESMKAGKQDVWSGIPDPIGKVQTLLDIVLDAESVSGGLLLRIAESEYADLTDFPGRSEVWEKLPRKPKEKFLERTAEGWVDRFAANPGFEGKPEEPLRSKVLQPSRLNRLLGPGESISRGLQVFKTFDELKEHKFQKWLNGVLSRSANINPIDSTEIGKLISQRGWNNTASIISERVANRPDLKPALRECEELLSIFERLATVWGGMDTINVTRDDWWEALTQITSELYPRGITENMIWERAGGDISKISTEQPGEAQWREAIQKLRHGGAGHEISLDGLLYNLREEYPDNDRLELLDEMQREVLK